MLDIALQPHPAAPPQVFPVLHAGTPQPHLFHQASTGDDIIAVDTNLEADSHLEGHAMRVQVVEAPAS